METKAKESSIAGALTSYHWRVLQLNSPGIETRLLFLIVLVSLPQHSESPVGESVGWVWVMCPHLGVQRQEAEGPRNLASILGGRIHCIETTHFLCGRRSHWEEVSARQPKNNLKNQTQTRSTTSVKAPKLSPALWHGVLSHYILGDNLSQKAVERIKMANGCLMLSSVHKWEPS